MSLKAFVDQVEEGLALVVLSDDDSVYFNLPLRYLPPGTRAGSHLQLNFSLDDEAARQTQERAEELSRELTKDFDPSQKKFNL